MRSARTPTCGLAGPASNIPCRTPGTSPGLHRERDRGDTDTARTWPMRQAVSRAGLCRDRPTSHLYRSGTDRCSPNQQTHAERSDGTKRPCDVRPRRRRSDERSNPQGKPDDLVSSPIFVGETRRLVSAVEPEIADRAQRHGEIPEHPDRRSHPADDTNRPKRGHKCKRRRREKRKPEELRIELSGGLRPASPPRQPPLCVRRPALRASDSFCYSIPSKRIPTTPAAVRGLAAGLAEMFGVGAHALMVLLLACRRQAVVLTPLAGWRPR